MSTAKFDTLQNAAGTKSVPVSTVVDGSAKAWVNFNGTGTIAIRQSFNVSSITDNGSGDYTVNFTNALTNANYAVTSTSRHVGSGGSIMSIHNTVAPTASACRILLYNTVSGFLDTDYVTAAFHR
jgi:hypothetical protein